ncbi:hypothetical protein [Actinomadura macra]|uniref:hypothetical protein n=1 Tax=Actinomadura macra TaxID=46164 RepID=UPI0012FC1EC4|nr:hypothetical protein [Actinomadura macra]
MTRQPRSIVRPDSTAAAGQSSPNAPRFLPFTANGTSFTGPGAEDAVRHLSINILRRRQGDSAELVLSRPDARRLFGTDIGAFREDLVPGLLLTDDPEQTHALLARHTMTRRVLVTYDETEDFREVLNHQQGQLAVVSLSPRAWAPTEILANGAITSSNDADSSSINHLPLLSKTDALNQLMSMPTLARHRDGQTASGNRVSTTP